MSARYDAIVVGARCAGSPIAMLLARRGYRVLLLDRATFPSDTLSTHLVHPPGMAALRRWGLDHDVIASGCPSIDTYAFDFGPFTIAGSPGMPHAPVAYAPRRTVLDSILVGAAAAAGAQVRQGFTVTEILSEDGCVRGVRGHARNGPTVSEHADLVIGADGLRSTVAQAVTPAQYRDKPRLLCGYYTYWRGLHMDGRFETYVRDARAFAAWPTNDDLTVVIGGWPYSEFEANRHDLERNYLAMFDAAPAFADRLHSATRVGRIIGTAVPNFFRKPFGPGWALVGDAGYNRDFITAQGIQDAFRDAELCADAIDRAFRADAPFTEAMSRYQAARDAAVLPMFEFTTELATLEPPPEEVAQVLAAAAGNQAAMDGFARVAAGVDSPADYFDSTARAQVGHR